MGLLIIKTAPEELVICSLYGRQGIRKVFDRGSCHAVSYTHLYKGYVYMRSFKAAPDAAKRAALAALDIVRRLSLKAPVENVRVFKANTD